MQQLETKNIQITLQNSDVLVNSTMTNNSNFKPIPEGVMTERAYFTHLSTTFENIMPNPLNANKLINYKYRQFATSDLDGIENSNILGAIQSVVSNKEIDEGMYMPALGELGIAMQNISYINNVISNNDGLEISLNDKYVSSTLYKDKNQQISNVNDVWYFDTTYAKMAYSSILDNYKVIPFYKYSPFIDYFFDEEEEEPEIREIEYDNAWDAEHKDLIGLGKYNKVWNLSEQYICGDTNITSNLIQKYFSSFLFFSRNQQKLQELALSKITFINIVNNLSKYTLDIMQLYHSRNTIVFNQYNDNNSEDYYCPFIICLPSFYFNEYKYAIMNEDDENSIRDLYKIKIVAKFYNGQTLEFKPISKYQQTLDFLIFTSNNTFSISDKELNNYFDNKVKFAIHYVFGNEDVLLFETEYMFDIYQFLQYGGGYTNINNYGTLQFIKTNILHSSIYDEYISTTNLPILYLNAQSLNISKVYSKDGQDGFRLCKTITTSDYIYSNYVDNEQIDKSIIGISYLSNNNYSGYKNTNDISSYFNIDNNSLTDLDGNFNISITSKVFLKSSLILRTFKEIDKFGIYCDCILNNLVDTENTTIESKYTDYGNYGYQYDIRNLPICGGKQILMFTPIMYEDISNLEIKMFTNYLFLYNSSYADLIISFEDQSKTLTRTITEITLKPHEMKLYYPAMLDYDYDIVISVSSMNSKYFYIEKYDLFTYIISHTTNESIPQKLCDKISYIYDNFYAYLSTSLPTSLNDSDESRAEKSRIAYDMGIYLKNNTVKTTHMNLITLTNRYVAFPQRCNILNFVINEEGSYDFIDQAHNFDDSDQYEEHPDQQHYFDEDEEEENTNYPDKHHFFDYMEQNETVVQYKNTFIEDEL